MSEYKNKGWLWNKVIFPLFVFTSSLFAIVFSVFLILGIVYFITLIGLIGLVLTVIAITCFIILYIIEDIFD